MSALRARHAVAAAVRLVAEIGPPTRGLVRATTRSHGVRAPFARVEVGTEPVRAPLPHVPGRVVQPVSVRLEGVDRAGAVEAVRERVVGRERALPDVHAVRARPAPARRPTGTAAPRARRAPRTPTRPRSAAACPPSRSTPARRSTSRARRGGPAARRDPTAAPPGAASRPPSTCRHHCACATARVGGKSSGSRPANTNDQPKRSASVS